MQLRHLAFAALVSLLPATAPALSVQYNLNDGQGFKDFAASPNLVVLNPGVYNGVQIRINQSAGDSVAGYVLNMQGSGGFAAIPFSDPFDDDGDPNTAGVPTDVTCRVRAAADSNCGVAFIGGIQPPSSRPSNTTAFGTAETFGSDVTFAIVAFSKLDLDARAPFGRLVFAQGSSVLIGGAGGGELQVGGLGFSVIPEPGTVLLLGAGLAGLALSGRKRAA